MAAPRYNLRITLSYRQLGANTFACWLREIQKHLSSLSLSAKKWAYIFLENSSSPPLRKGGPTPFTQEESGPQDESASADLPKKTCILHSFRTYILCCLIAKSCLTLCDPIDCSTPGFPVLHYLWEFAQIRVSWIDDAIQPSHPPSPPSPAFHLSQH